MVPVTVGVGAGFAAALLLLAPNTLTLLAIPLFILSPLPAAIASLGWGWMSGAIAVLVAGLAMAGAYMAIAGAPVVGLALAVTFILPVVWLAYLATRVRPGAEGAESVAVEPSYGSILVHAVFVVSGLIVLAGAAIGYDPAVIHGWMTEMIGLWGTGSDALVPPEDIERVADFATAVYPYSVTSTTLLMMVLSLWLGAKIAASSGLLQGPLRPFSSTTLPAWLAGVFAIALIAIRLPFPIGPIASVLVGATMTAFILNGLAAFHTMSQGQPLRGPMLAAVYVTGILFGVPFFIALVLGIADSIVNVRGRFPRPPPPTNR